ncbi:multidrug efflux system, subunit C [Candidatus Methylobacter favarea]|uniref:Multidrug efflux system, subunit C n=1 Tax=Candidatus Methylobacter favarea TaxID=2707345 RepID=A0A8S0X7D4_9GAMM|nr:multidrug efflux RND transporter permease subunit [Candidatus Methylobacter favarea]CAA9889957.1 multidrug efflux system, subunit C [Candidatus Methylobacter favarea]
MTLSSLFIFRPVATTLLSLGVVLAGLLAFFQLPVAPLPQVDFPTISVQAALPGASSETMAAIVATPLERSLGHIAGINEMTSASSFGTTRINLQFDLDRDIDGAARDVQAAINAASSLLPANLPSRPRYRKVNPADAPIMIIALTSDTHTRGQLYDAASTVLAQKISRIKGIGQVYVGGSSLPAVRVELNPAALARYGIGFSEVRSAIAAANVTRPKGSVEEAERYWQIDANDQAKTANDYLPLIVAYRNGAAVRISDLGTAVDSVEDLRHAGLKDGKPSVLLILSKQPGANIIDTVNGVKALLPQLQASIPGAIDLSVVMDRAGMISASLHEVELSLLLAVALVIAVVFVFLRNLRSALVPVVAVPMSLIGTFAIMHLCHYSLNNLSLMALTIATGFVVDDAIVVLENSSRYIEKGMAPREAALKGAGEVGFTVLSMSLSLIAVFFPLLLMGGVVGRLFREFAVTLSVAVIVSLVVSLTTTPMLCAHWLAPAEPGKHGRLYHLSGRFFNRLSAGYERTLHWALDHGVLMIVLLLCTIALNVYLYVIVPKGFFPSQDSGRLAGTIQADQGISSRAMQQKLTDFVEIVRADAAVRNVIGFTGGQQLNTGRIFVTLKPLDERQESVDQIMVRLRARLAHEPGASLFLQPVQDLRIGARGSAATFEYTLQAERLAELRTWMPRILAALSRRPELVDVNTDQQEKGQQITLQIDHDEARRLGVNQALIDSTLNDAFGQRQVSVIYNPLNQYRVVMEAAPEYWQNPDILKKIYVSVPPSPLLPAGAQVPLSAFASYGPSTTPLSVNHLGQFAAATFSFNLKPGVSLSAATAIIDQTMQQLRVPESVHGSFQGSAKAFQKSLQNQPWLILAALASIYIVLGILYESYVHPLTIISTLPSAGVGAILALLAFKTEFSIIALIGVILLIGIVKKNAIMMIDFALNAERTAGKSPREAIFTACLMRFRPIMMTTFAALLAALPLALGSGYGAELRRPLGISIFGGLMVSQLLTLYTTPVVYLYMDRFRLWGRRRFRSRTSDQLAARLERP